MPAQIPSPKQPGAGFPRRGKAAKKKWQSRKLKSPEKAEVKVGEVSKREAKRRPEWHAAREAGAARQAEALAGLAAARAATSGRRIEILVSLFSPSRRSKPTLAHVQFVKDGQVFAHYYPAASRLFFGRKGKIADEGRYETLEEATLRVVAYDDEIPAAASS